MPGPEEWHHGEFTRLSFWLTRILDLQVKKLETWIGQLAKPKPKKKSPNKSLILIVKRPGQRQPIKKEIFPEITVLFQANIMEITVAPLPLTSERPNESLDFHPLEAIKRHPTSHCSDVQVDQLGSREFYFFRPVLRPASQDISGDGGRSATSAHQ